MKKYILLFSIASILLAGCDDVVEYESALRDKQNENVSVNSYKISHAEALEFSNEVLKKISTRSTPLSLPSFDYVVDVKTTRSTVSNDTLAYVINYPNEAGFVIVATDKRVNPLLAFSETGNFSFDNEIAKVNFIEKLGTYIEKSKSDTPCKFPDISFDNSRTVEPFIDAYLNQRSPWDKYVIMEHPGCPVGCVAVATAYVMSYSKEKLAYHGEEFLLKTIVSAIRNVANDQDQSENQTQVRGVNLLPPPSIYSYTWGQDKMAKLLYWIGKDVDMQYGTQSSGAYSEDAFNLCESLNFTIPSGFSEFNVNEIAKFLRTDHVIYLRGSNLKTMGGHAWVSDGCMSAVSAENPEKPMITYIHCNWGWGGNGNGYYKGDIFEVGDRTYKPLQFFAVKREWK